MSDMSEATPAGTGAASGGKPSESDLPAMQGLGESTDDPSDPTAARRKADGTGDDAAVDPDALSSADDEGPSDPMPDMSGTTGS